MHRFVLASLLLVVSTACPADPAPGETQTSIPDTCGTGGCDPDTTTTDGPGPADSTTLDCSTGGCCIDGPGSCESTTSSSTDAGETTTGGPGVEPPCGFGDTLAMLAMGKTEPIDCGTVTLDDDVTAWEAASDCAASAAAAQEAFFVAFQQPSDDSLVFDGFYGVVGIVYGLGRLYVDTFADPMLVTINCMGVAAVDDCMVDVGQHCLTCMEPSPQMPLECVMR